LKAAFKLIRNYDIRSVDFTSSGIHDDSMRMLSSYLRSDPNLRSIVLDNNMFTDDGMSKLVRELEGNTKLAHLSIRGCTNVTDAGLQKLCDVISTTNTCLFQVDLDIDHFDEELARTVVTESVLNRDIQEKLKPIRVITHLNMAGEIIRVIRGSEQREIDSD
jgi:Ran GTPase-activating protein (RanGAP) involved in mRNA processing and transport